MFPQAKASVRLLKCHSENATSLLMALFLLASLANAQCFVSAIPAEAHSDLSPINGDQQQTLQQDQQLSDDNNDVVVKRDWKRLGATWGRRLPNQLLFDDATDIYVIDNDQLGSIAVSANDFLRAERELELQQLQDVDAPVDNDFIKVKRDWKNMNAAWGKRRNSPTWNKFAGAWGKRETGWNNLKGMWGKRSVQFSSSPSHWNSIDNDLINSEDKQHSSHSLYFAYPHDKYFDKRSERNWHKLNAGWGKRSPNDWNKLQGYWGKRAAID